MRRVAFSTLGCPDWTLGRAIDTAVALGYDGVELRYIEGDAALHDRPELRGSGLAETSQRLRDAGLAVPCLASGVSFDNPNPRRRFEAVAEAAALVEAAAALGARGIRVFGNHIPHDGTRHETERWIADGLERVRDVAWASGVEVWLESHGDFARSPELLRAIDRTSGGGIGALWDPANAFEAGELPAAGAAVLGNRIRHVHVKDLVRRPGMAARPMPMGTGEFPADEAFVATASLAPDVWVSFEWEKRWHPDIDPPETAFPQFLGWLRAH